MSSKKEMSLDDEKMKEMIRQFALQKQEEEDKDEAFGSSLHGPALWRYVDSKPKDRLPRRKRAAVRTFGPAVDRARVSTFVVPGGCFMCDKLNDCIVRLQALWRNVTAGEEDLGACLTGCCMLRIRGLNGRPELNGAHVAQVANFDSKTQRYKVALLMNHGDASADGAEEQWLKVRPRNLEPVEYPQSMVACIVGPRVMLGGAFPFLSGVQSTTQQASTDIKGNSGGTSNKDGSSSMLACLRRLSLVCKSWAAAVHLDLPRFLERGKRDGAMERELHGAIRRLVRAGGQSYTVQEERMDAERVLSHWAPALRLISAVVARDAGAVPTVESLQDIGARADGSSKKKKKDAASSSCSSSVEAPSRSGSASGCFGWFEADPTDEDPSNMRVCTGSNLEGFICNVVQATRTLLSQEHRSTRVHSSSSTAAAAAASTQEDKCRTAHGRTVSILADLAPFAHGDAEIAYLVGELGRIILSMFGDEEVAEIVVDALVRTFPNDSGAMFTSIDILRAMGRKEKAAEVLRSALANPELTIGDRQNAPFDAFAPLLPGGAVEFARRAAKVSHPPPKPPLMSTFDAEICAGRIVTPGRPDLHQVRKNAPNPFWCPAFMEGMPIYGLTDCRLTCPFRSLYGGPPPCHDTQNDRTYSISDTLIRDVAAWRVKDPAVAYCRKKHPPDMRLPNRAVVESDAVSASEKQAAVDTWNKNLKRYASKGRQRYGDARPEAEILSRFSAPLSDEALEAHLDEPSKLRPSVAEGVAEGVAEEGAGIDKAKPNTGDSSAATRCSSFLLKECAHCMRRELVPGQFKTCSGCHQVAYCCKEDQRAHWKEHKLLCTGRKRTNTKQIQLQKAVRELADGS